MNSITWFGITFTTVRRIGHFLLEARERRLKDEFVDTKVEKVILESLTKSVFGICWYKSYYFSILPVLS